MVEENNHKGGEAMEFVGTCAEHSGLKVWVQVGCGLLTILIALFSYSTFIQVPETKSQLEKYNSALDKRIYAIERDVSDLKGVDQRIITRMNESHPKGDKFQ